MKKLKFGAIFTLVLCICTMFAFGGGMRGAGVFADDTPIDEAEVVWFGEDGRNTGVYGVYSASDGYFVSTATDEFDKVIKFDEDDEMVWEIPEIEFYVQKVVEAADGSVYLIGNSYLPGALAFLSKYNNEGELDWETRFDDIACTEGDFDIAITDIEIYKDSVIAMTSFSGDYDIEINEETVTFENRGGEGTYDSLIFRFDFDGSVTYVKQYGGAGDTFMTNIKTLKNGNFADSGTFRDTTTGIPGLSTVSPATVSFVTALTYEQLFSESYEAQWVQTILPGSGNLYFNSLYVFNNIIIAFGGADSAPSANGSIGTWGANDALVFAFDGVSGQLLYEPVAIPNGDGMVTCNAAVIDNDGTLLIGLSVIDPGHSWAKFIILKYDVVDGEPVWEETISDMSSTTYLEGIVKIDDKILVFGSADERFDSSVMEGDTDGFIMTFDAADVQITPPEAEAGSYTFGDFIPELVGGSANIPGNFGWKDGASTSLMGGTLNYTCMFVPDSKLIEPTEYQIAITTAKANRPTPTALLKVNEVTANSIELVPVVLGSTVEYAILDKNGDIIKTWQTSTLFEGLKANTAYKITYRLKADTNYNASADYKVEGEYLTQKTDKGPSNSFLYIMIVALVLLMAVSMISRRKRMAAADQNQQRPRPPQNPQPPQNPLPPLE